MHSQLWKKSGASPNQINRIIDIDVSPRDLLLIPGGGVTMQGLKHNVAVSILFIYHWLAGIGHFFYNGNVEDSATAEISRAQIWQWIRFSVRFFFYMWFFSLIKFFSAINNDGFFYYLVEVRINFHIIKFTALHNAAFLPLYQNGEMKILINNN